MYQCEFIATQCKNAQKNCIVSSKVVLLDTKDIDFCTSERIHVKVLLS